MIGLRNDDGKFGTVERDELWIQCAVEQFHDARGYYPPTLAPAIADHPNALIALDHLGWTRVHYELHATRGYVLAFLRHKSEQGQPVLKIADRESYLRKLSELQQAVSRETAVGE